MNDFCMHHYEPFYVVSYRGITEDEFFAAAIFIIITVGIALLFFPFFYYFGHRQRAYEGHFCKHCGLKQQ